MKKDMQRDSESPPLTKPADGSTRPSVITRQESMILVRESTEQHEPVSEQQEPMSEQQEPMIEQHEPMFVQHEPKTPTKSSIFSKPDSTITYLDDLLSEDAEVARPPVRCLWLKSFIHHQLYIPNHLIFSFFGNLLFAMLSWAVLMALFQKEALPDGEIFHLYFLVVSCFFVGEAFRLCRLPALLGQLTCGIIFRSTGFIRAGEVYLFLIPVVRAIAMAIILIKAALGMELDALLKLKWVICKLTVLPCISEAGAAAVIAHFVIGCSWLWAFLLGFLLSSISPAVVIPPLLHLKSQGYGEDKGIATVIIAASGLDDILSISCFSIFFSMLFKPSANVWLEILHGPIDLLIGTFLGIVWGLICALIPHKENSTVHIRRSWMIAFGGIAAVFASMHFNIDSAGPIFCMVSASVATICWKIQHCPINRPVGDGMIDESVVYFYRIIWIIVEPFLFGMIGSEIDLKTLVLVKVGNSVLIIVGALAVRTLVCCLSLLSDNLNWKEMLFVNLAWLPKATVQAAIGSLPLDHLRGLDNVSEEDLETALLLLTTAVLSILITAPLGAIFIQITGPILLSKPDSKEIPKQTDMEK